MVHRHMNVEIGAEAALSLEKEYINGISVVVWAREGFWIASLFVVITVQ